VSSSLQGTWQVTVEGQLSKEDYDCFRETVVRMQRIGAVPSSEPWAGLLAEGNMSDADIIYRYPIARQASTEVEIAFMALVGILKPYMEEFCDKRP